MKKLLILLVAAVVSTLAAFADQTSCRVYGANTVATLNQTTVIGSTSIEAGTHWHFVKVNVELTEAVDKQTNVVVNVSNGSRVIASGVVRISNGYKTGNAQISSAAIETGQTYYLSIAGASCE